MNHIHTITFKIIKNFINYIGHKKRRTTWESCRDVVEMDHDIKQLEQCKQKIEDDLEELNGQLLSSLKKHYTEMEERNTHLRSAYVRKLKFSPQKAVKDKIDNRKK